MKLEDRFEIQELISKLAYTHDTLDYEGYRDLYTEDLLRSNKWKDKEPEYREGREKSVGVTVNRLKMLREQGIVDRHYYLNPILEEVSDDEVKGMVSFLIVAQQGEEVRPSLVNSGLADLVFRRTDRGWKIAQFHIKFDIPDQRPK
jgi:hypothetical protein